MILYPGCLAEYVYPEIAESARDALAALGLRAVLADEPVCCGIPALYAGDQEPRPPWRAGPSQPSSARATAR